METLITKIVHIKNQSIKLNGKMVMEDHESATYSEFIRVAYKYAGMAYPKFYKMDNPCKLALIAAELLLKDTSLITKYGKENIGIVVQNASSTLSTDLEFQSTIDERSNYFPSPAVFVYTLPNIMLGEICIRHKFFGENALLIEPSFNPAALLRHLEILFAEKRVKVCLAGWVEENKSNYEAFLYLTETESNEADIFNLPHLPEELTSFYKSQ